MWKLTRPVWLLLHLICCLVGPVHAQQAPPLSRSDTNAVIRWIADQVSSARQPYCYRQSYDRYAGVPLSTCTPEQEKNGALCYPKCPDGYGGAGPVCWEHCPAGYVDTGALCTRPASTQHLSIHSADCPHHFHNTGVSCYRAWPPKSESLDHATCPQGMERKGAFCYSRCPDGYTNTGVSCYRGPDTIAKKTHDRGAGTPMICQPGLQEDAGLCYQQCKPGFHGVANYCWENCQAGKTACGAGCASDTKACIGSTASMVIAPAMLAWNILTDGTTSGLMARFQSEIKAAKLLKSAANAGYELAKTREAWIDLLMTNFAGMTTPEVDRLVKANLKPEVQNYIKRQYAMNSLHLLYQQELGDSAINALNGASGFDPTGITSVISAFANPRCFLPEPFPVTQN